MKITTFRKADPGFPRRLDDLGEHCPPTLCVGGHLSFDRAIAIVGSRHPSEEGREFARELAKACAKAGAVVVSGGAQGIDEAAHRGALAAKGQTWVVWAHGSAQPYAADRREFALEMRKDDGVAFVYPFEATTAVSRPSYTKRNGPLAALAHEVVIVEAGLASGTRNTYGWAKKLGRPLWIVPIAPWAKNSAGSLWMLEDGAKVIRDIPHFLGKVGLRPLPPASQLELPAMDLLMRQVFDVVGRLPTHVDFIVEKTRLPTSAVASTLLTLALEHVLVEGPPGHYRRA